MGKRWKNKLRGSKSCSRIWNIAMCITFRKENDFKIIQIFAFSCWPILIMTRHLSSALPASVFEKRRNNMLSQSDFCIVSQFGCFSHTISRAMNCCKVPFCRFLHQPKHTGSVCFLVLITLLCLRYVAKLCYFILSQVTCFIVIKFMATFSCPVLVSPCPLLPQTPFFGWQVRDLLWSSAVLTPMYFKVQHLV